MGLQIQTITSVYYVLADICVLSQYAYYGTAWRRHRPTTAGGTTVLACVAILCVTSYTTGNWMTPPGQPHLDRSFSNPTSEQHVHVARAHIFRETIVRSSRTCARQSNRQHTRSQPIQQLKRTSTSHMQVIYPHSRTLLVAYHNSITTTGGTLPPA
jgi:hypothetical protein